MKAFLNKIKDFFQKEKIKKVTDWCVGHRRYFLAVLLFLVLLVVLYACTGPNAKKQSDDKKNNDGQTATESSQTADFTLDADFEKDAHEDVNALIQNYFAAYASADIETLETIASPISDNEKSYIQVFGEYIESYENIACYTKRGLTDDSYLVSAYFDLKFYGVETMAPGLDFFYVETKEDGSLYINNLYSPYNLNRTENSLDPNVYAVILQFEQQDDVVKLREEVESAYSEAVASDVDLATMLSTTIPDAMTAWMESVTAPKEDTETDDATDGTETPADDTGADEAPADDAVAEETPADDAAVDETPAEETPADDAVADETPADDAPAADENKEVRVKVNIKSVKVREKASTSSDVIAGAEKGDTFTKLGETDGWTKIDYNGKIGYIKSDYVDEVTE
ncbi:MAG: SH3 domain-containing protein [Agathobacter sp.]|nr:SH3 domain-containing protein [Agathobacter sp.]